MRNSICSRALLFLFTISAFMAVSGNLALAQTTAANQWTWAGGSDTGSNYYPIPGVYGALGTPAAGNMPGGRKLSVTWADKSGHLWLFGGSTYDNSSNPLWLNDMWEFDPKIGEWAWMGGSNAPSNTCPQSGTLGTVGVPAPGNIPSARYGSASWVDQQGHLWLFGGDVCSNYQNDLWEFDPTTNEWAFIAGSTSGKPPGVYGTLGVAATQNVPGGRFGASTWTDQNGHLWLFGGFGYDSKSDLGSLNDLWEFDSSVGQWKWVSGDSTLAQNGDTQPSVYGTLGTPSPQNKPGGRQESIGWSDTNGRFWLFGGGYSDLNVGFVLSNEMWMFDPGSGEWTWMNGSNLPGSNCSQVSPGINECGATGVYGAIGTPDPANTPGGRFYANYWTENTGRLWLFGGDGFNGNAGLNGWLNDLWAFNPNTDQWTWMGGSNGLDCPGGICSQTGTYGTLGIPAAANYPGARNSAESWTDSNGNFWMYGGGGFDSKANEDFLDDIWVFQPSDTTNLPSPDFSLKAQSTTLSISSGQSTSTEIGVNASGGFNQTVSLSCSGLPAGLSCAFSPSSVTPQNGTALSTLTIAKSSTSAQIHPSPAPLVVGTSFAALLFCIPFGNRRRYKTLLMVLFFAGVLGALSGCSSNSGGGVSSPPGPSTSSFTVTGTSGGSAHSVSISLTVN